MSGTRAVAETFSIEFDGPAFDKHQIPAAALAQSLLALDDLAKRISDVAYGKEAEAEIKVNAVKAGSFIVELYQECTATPLAAAASAVTVLTGVGYTLKKLLQLGKWALGKKVKVVEDQATNPNVTVENELGDRLQFDRCIVNIYNNNRTKPQLSRLTQTKPNGRVIIIQDRRQLRQHFFFLFDGHKGRPPVFPAGRRGGLDGQ